jgi:CubicO group peptidase (beta-lactamase class C family)
MKNTFIACSLLLLQTCMSFAQYQPPVFTSTDRLQKIEATWPLIDQLFKEYAHQNNFPGFAYGLMVDGQLIRTGSTGFTDLDKKIPASPQSQFRIASMSKSFTTMAILQLRDAGKLSLDDPAEKYIAALKTVKLLTTDAPKITIRHLLTHAAGFPEDNPWGDRQLADTNQELMQLIQSSPAFSNVPGIAYEYSNLGITLLGYVIEKVSGKPYQQYINEQVLKPLGMNNTHWEYTKVPASALAHGYRWHNNQWKEEALLHDGAYGAMGGLITSVEDFGKYMALHAAAWPPRNDTDNNPLKRASIREMHQPWNFNTLSPQSKTPNGKPCPTTSAYGYGLAWLRDCDNKVFVGHSGGLPGFGSNWRIMPDYGIGVVCMANLTYAPTGGINLRVLDTLIAKAQLKPRPLPASDILKKRQSELVSFLPDWNNADKSSIFAENFFADYLIKDLKDEANFLFKKSGKILKVRDIIPENQLRGAFVLEGEKANLMVSFTLTPENPPTIQEYHIWEIKK